MEQQEEQINTSNINQDMFVISERKATDNVKSDQLDFKANENITLENISTKGIATLESGNTTDAKIVRVTELNTTSKGNTNFDELKVDKMDAVSKCGNFKLHEKSKAKEAKQEAKHVDNFLAGNNNMNKKANHEFGYLTLNKRALVDINKLLTTSDCYKNLKIADRLGLIVEDQKVIIATQQKSQYSLSIKSASIDERRGMDAKNLEEATTKGILKIDKNVKIKQKENVRLTSREKLQLCESSSVSAGQTINLESKKGSVSLSASELDAGSGMKIKAHHDINDANGGLCEGSKLSAGRKNKEQSAIDIEAERSFKIHASDNKGQGGNTFKAGNNISITANKHETAKRKTKSSWLGLCRTTTETTMTHVEQPTISGRLNIFKAGGNFKSVTGNIKSEFGNDIRATGGVSMLDLQNTTKTKATSSFLGMKYYQKDESSHQSQGTSLEDLSTEARTSTISETSNIEWHRTNLKSAGIVSEIAEMGEITHSRRLSNHETKETGIKDYTQNATKDKDGHFRIEVIYERGNYPITSTDSTNIGGDYTLKAEKLNVLNSANIDVKGNINGRTDDVRIAGASLEASDQRVNIGIGDESSMAFPL